MQRDYDTKRRHDLIKGPKGCYQSNLSNVQLIIVLQYKLKMQISVFVCKQTQNKMSHNKDTGKPAFKQVPEKTVWFDYRSFPLSSHSLCTPRETHTEPGGGWGKLILCSDQKQIQDGMTSFSFFGGLLPRRRRATNGRRRVKATNTGKGERGGLVSNADG